MIEPWKLKRDSCENVEIRRTFYLVSKMDRWYDCDGGYVDKVPVYFT